MNDENPKTLAQRLQEALQNPNPSPRFRMLMQAAEESRRANPPSPQPDEPTDQPAAGGPDTRSMPAKAPGRRTLRRAARAAAATLAPIMVRDGDYVYRDDGAGNSSIEQHGKLIEHPSKGLCERAAYALNKAQRGVSKTGTGPLPQMPDPLPHDLIDPDRSLLAQLEEDAINGDDDTYEWLIKEAYHDPDIMSLCHNFRIQIPDNQQEQPPPVLTWEEIERGRAGLSGTSEMPLAPTVAERAFLALARDWQAEVEKAPKASVLPRDVDIRALACLLLAVEWGEEFTGVAREQMEANRVTAAERQHPSWMNELPWRLCQSANIMGPPPERDAVQELTANLDHHKSSIRCWMMEIGWFAFSWLNPVEAAVRLLNNLADTLAGPFMAAGLAARFFDKPESFLAFARSFTPPESFKEQYRDRLKYVEEHGVKAMQAPFWQSEAICRKEIERVILGFQRAGEHRT